MKKVYFVYCAYPYTGKPRTYTKEIKNIVRKLYDNVKTTTNDLVCIIPHLTFDAPFNFPEGNSNQWMLLLELAVISRCDILAYDPNNQSAGVHWEQNFAKLNEIPILTYDEILEGKRPKPRQRERFLYRKMRNFKSGATRDSCEDKLDYEGFLSPLVLQAFAEYMHENRKQADGKLRASDNWQKGIPIEAYMKSAWRHFMDLWMEHRGLKSREGIDKAFGGLLFNIMGYWHELLKGANKKQ